jgi:hypothetical protein
VKAHQKVLSRVQEMQNVTSINALCILHQGLASSCVVHQCMHAQTPSSRISCTHMSTSRGTLS